MHKHWCVRGAGRRQHCRRKHNCNTKLATTRHFQRKRYGSMLRRAAATHSCTKFCFYATRSFSDAIPCSPLITVFIRKIHKIHQNHFCSFHFIAVAKMVTSFPITFSLNVLRATQWFGTYILKHRKWRWFKRTRTHTWVHVADKRRYICFTTT